MSSFKFINIMTKEDGRYLHDVLHTQAVVRVHALHGKIGDCRNATRVAFDLVLHILFSPKKAIKHTRTHKNKC